MALFSTFAAQGAAMQQPAAATQPTPEIVDGVQPEYLGMVKSYNARRGFGFVACAATAEKYGRDVYIAKAEAQLAFAEGTPPGAIVARSAADKQQPPSLAEEDLIRFRVRLSVEGFPQAEQIQRLRKFQGTVMQPPALEGAPVTEGNGDGRIVSDELAAVFGQREAILRRDHCGHARLAVGDRVTFCIQSEGELVTLPNGQRLREALLVMLVPRPVHAAGILGCFVLNLPRAPVREGWPMRANMLLDCHALNDRIILSGLPRDTDENELMRFFSKHGAIGAHLVRANTSAFASVAFPSSAEPTRFVARCVHTFADDKETRLARLQPPCHGAECASRLPGLPQPMLTHAGEAGVLFVAWSPVVLAISYAVELRPAGVQAPWTMVNASNGQLGNDGATRFDRDCSSCRVTGLPTNTVFEARVTYFTTCGCQSDASDASEWCMACASPAPAMPGVMAMPQLATMPGAGTNMKYFWPQGATPMPMMPQQMAPQMMPENWSGAWQPQPTLLSAVPQQQPQPQPPQQQPQQQPQQIRGWRCAHGQVAPAPPMPELRAGDDAGFAIVVQWPSVANATAYVVELAESGSTHTERFIRSVPMQAAGLVELRIGGLRPSGGPGRRYVAQVRSVTACGCESEPSLPGYSQALGAAAAMPQQPQQPQQARPTLSLAASIMQPENTWAPPSQPQHEQQQQPPPQQQPQMQQQAAEQAKLGPQHVPPSTMAAAGGAGKRDELPSLLKSSRPPVPPPTGLPPTLGGSGKEPMPEIAPEIAGHEAEDCIILD